MAKIIGNTTATPNPRPDWNQIDVNKADYIKNKPTVLTRAEVIGLIKENGGDVGVQSDWNQTDSTQLDYIKNKPEIVDLSINEESVVATEGQDIFPVSFDSVQNLQVYHNGLLLVEDVNYTFADGTVALLGDDYAAEEGDLFIFVETNMQRVEGEKGNANILNGTASGEVVALKDVSPIEHNLGVRVESKNLAVNVWSAHDCNTILENGIVTQIEADTYETIYLKAQVYQDTTLISDAGVLSMTSIGIHSRSFTKATAGNTLVFGLNGRERDTIIRIDITDLPEGVYTVSANFTNLTQGSISWCDIMLNKGTTATPYTPYIEDTTAARIGTQGKNLFDVSKIITSSTVINNGDGTILVKNNGGQATNRTFKELCPELKAGDTFTLSLRTTNAVMDSKVGGYIYIAGSYNKILNSGSTYTATQEMLDGGVLLYKAHYSYQEQVEEGIVSEIQVEIGTTATEYEPYKEPIEYSQGEDIKSIYPSTTLMTDTEGVVMTVEYQRDVNKVINSLEERIAMLEAAINK